ncbi:MAG: GlsB/YeaQ/YmgE family stress response membrane protein [Polyangiales bacterium]
MGILSWVAVGLLGALAKLIMPGRQGGGCLVTTALGIVGGVVGGFLGSRLGLGTMDGFNVGSLLLAVGGALVVLLVYGLLTRKR